MCLYERIILLIFYRPTPHSCHRLLPHDYTYQHQLLECLPQCNMVSLQNKCRKHNGGCKINKIPLCKKYIVSLWALGDGDEHF